MSIELNQNGRRIARMDELDLYDIKKARPFFINLCKQQNWKIVKDVEDYKEDFVLDINNIFYYIEIQVVGHWHNFDLNKIANLYISEHKIKVLREINQEHRGTLIFTNCVPNRWIGFNVEQVKEEWKYQDQNTKEYSYKLPIKELDIVENKLLDENLCDCLDNHLEIMERSAGKLDFANKSYNIRGKNGICC